MSEYKQNIAEIHTCEAFKPEKTEVHLLPDEEHKKLLLDPLGEIAATPTISEMGIPPYLEGRLPTQEDCKEIVRYLNSGREKALSRYQLFELAPTIQWNPVEKMFSMHYSQLCVENATEIRRWQMELQHDLRDLSYQKAQRDSGVKPNEIKNLKGIEEERVQLQIENSPLSAQCEKYQEEKEARRLDLKESHKKAHYGGGENGAMDRTTNWVLA